MRAFVVDQRVKVAKVPEDIYPQDWVDHVGAVKELEFWSGHGPISSDDPLYHVLLDIGQWAALWGEELEAT